MHASLSYCNESCCKTCLFYKHAIETGPRILLAKSTIAPCERVSINPINIISSRHVFVASCDDIRNTVINIGRRNMRTSLCSFFSRNHALPQATTGVTGARAGHGTGFWMLWSFDRMEESGFITAHYVSKERNTITK